MEFFLIQDGEEDVQKNRLFMDGMLLFSSRGENKMHDERKKVVKKILTAAGVVVGTCAISAGSFFLVDSGLAFLNTKIEKNNVAEKTSEMQQTNSDKETELITKTKDSFIVPEKKSTEKETDKKTDGDQTGPENSGTGSENTGGSQSAGNSDNNGGSSSSGNSSNGSDYNGNTNYDGNSDASGGTDGNGDSQNGNWVNPPASTPQTEAPQTNPPQTDPPQTEAPQTNPPQTDPPQTDPPQTEPPQTEAPPAAWDDTYFFPDTGTRYITENELHNMTDREIAIARNEIFARHGRKFTKQEWIDYFSTKTWYVPTYDPETFDSMDLLNDFEKKNLKVILAYEEKR